MLPLFVSTLASRTSNAKAKTCQRAYKANCLVLKKVYS